MAAAVDEGTIQREAAHLDDGECVERARRGREALEETRMTASITQSGEPACTHLSPRKCLHRGGSTQPAIRVLSAILRVTVAFMIERGHMVTWTPVCPAFGTPRHLWRQSEADEPT